MEAKNNSIREFTCDECGEVTKIDWSKIIPDLDDGTSNIEIYNDGGTYHFYGKCQNCGNLVMVEQPIPQLDVKQVDTNDYDQGIEDEVYAEIEDKITQRTTWLELEYEEADKCWTWEFSNTDFDTDVDNELLEMLFQQDIWEFCQDEIEKLVDTVIADYNLTSERITEANTKSAVDTFKNKYHIKGDVEVTDNKIEVSSLSFAMKTLDKRVEATMRKDDSKPVLQLDNEDITITYDGTEENMNLYGPYWFREIFDDEAEADKKEAFMKQLNTLYNDMAKLFTAEKKTECEVIDEKEIEESKNVTESVKWEYYDKFDDVNKKYFVREGEGDTKASQIVVALNQLVYKWYNDGDVYDTTNMIGYGANDMSSYANWLAKYVDGAKSILDEIFSNVSVTNSNAYEDILKRLSDKYLDLDYLKTQEVPKEGSIYECSGPYKYEDYLDENKKVTESDNSYISKLARKISEEQPLSKYLYKNTRLSGSSTYVQPIEIWENNNEIIYQITYGKTIDDKFIQAIVDKYPEITDGHFSKLDGSCPSELTFHYKLDDKKVEGQEVNSMNKVTEANNPTVTSYKIIIHCNDDGDKYDDEITGTYSSEDEAIKAMEDSALHELRSLQEGDDEEFASHYSLRFLTADKEKIAVMKDGEILSEYEVVPEETELPKVSEMSELDIIEELEGGELHLVDKADWEAVKNVALKFSSSQGYYGRLYRDMMEAEEEYGGEDEIPFPITM